MNEKELENEDSWDFEGAERRQPRRKSRAIVSVSFAPDDFDSVVDAAETAGMKVSEFIRHATLEKIGAKAVRCASFVLVVGPTLRELYVNEPAPATFSLWGSDLREGREANVISGWFA